MKIGDKVSIRVSFYDPDGKRSKETGGMKTVPARVTYINPAHRYFLAEYQAGRGTLRECFKF